MATRSVFEFYAQEDTGYSGEGRQQASWWRQTAAGAHIRATLKSILVASRERYRQESCRFGKSEEWQDGQGRQQGKKSDTGDAQVSGGLCGETEFLVYWYGDRGCPGGRMIMCGVLTSGNERVPGSGTPYLRG